jgi:uncharacterized protein YndB with AHSA1/START domain
MKNNASSIITVGVTVKASIGKIWEYWTAPVHITKWYQASEEWHTPYAENDLREGGKFLFRMEAKDGSSGFDFVGVYDKVNPNKYLEFTLGDDRKVNITFTAAGDETIIIESFEVENKHSAEQQKTGWQAILDSFKKYTE